VHIRRAHAGWIGTQFPQLFVVALHIYVADLISIVIFTGHEPLDGDRYEYQ
jgi:hypothetical protein